MSSTKTALIATIADDLARVDLTTQIGDAIDTAIKFYQNVRFFFNETRTASFVTVAAQSTYTVSDDADIPLWVTLDEVYLIQSTSTWCLDRWDPIEMEFYLVSSGAASGRPYAYAYFEESFRLYPVPDAVYTIKPMGVIKKDVPTSDGDTTNVWINNAYELLRCRAKAYLAIHVLSDMDLLVRMVGGDGQGGACGAAYSALQAETTKKTKLSRIVPTRF